MESCVGIRTANQSNFRTRASLWVRRPLHVHVHHRAAMPANAKAEGITPRLTQPRTRRTCTQKHHGDVAREAGHGALLGPGLDGVVASSEGGEGADVSEHFCRTRAHVLTMANRICNARYRAGTRDSRGLAEGAHARGAQSTNARLDTKRADGRAHAFRCPTYRYRDRLPRHALHATGERGLTAPWPRLWGCIPFWCYIGSRTGSTGRVRLLIFGWKKRKFACHKVGCTSSPHSDQPATQRSIRSNKAVKADIAWRYHRVELETIDRLPVFTERR